MKDVIKILLVEDDEDDVLLTREYLEEIPNSNFDVTWEPDIDAARIKMLTGEYDVFLLDYRLGRENGLELIKHVRSAGNLVPAIILTGRGDLKVDIDASASGASDYLVKSEITSFMLERSIRYALSQARIVRELDEKEKKYRSLFENSVDPIFLATQDLGLFDLNNSFINFFGYTEKRGESFTIENLFANSEDYEYFKDTLKRTELVKDFEVALKTSKGEKKLCVLNCIFIPDQASDFCCYQGIIHDLTMRKQAENDMLIAERLSLTGKIARTIAHEVRNPLTNLNLALDQLRSELPPDNESVQLYTDIIERNSNRIEHLVSEMLNSSKFKQLQLQETSINDIIDETIKLAMDRINLNQIKLEKECEKNLPSLMADREKLQIALLNIVINAIEAMIPGKGVLRIAGVINGDLLCIEISDNGKGISEDDLHKLFDPFFSMKQSGVGLGLTSTKSILQSHNAEIQVKSKVGLGTTFYITFHQQESGG